MKILHFFILKSYLGPFFRSFVISLFILVLQFISRYKEELFGKGLETIVIVKVFMYAMASLVVLALPVSVLLSSLMSMGSMGEHYELAAMRSSGCSLPRVLRPMFFATLVIAAVSFLMSIFVVPDANLKLYSLLYDVKQMKPEFQLKPNHFNNSIDGYSIHIQDANTKTKRLYDIKIYDHTDTLHVGDRTVVLADSGTMIVDPYGTYMRMTLYNGSRFVGPEVEDGRVKKMSNVRLYFEKMKYNFKMKGFGLKRTEEEAFSSHQLMLNINQLQASMDSVEGVMDHIGKLYVGQLEFHFKVDSTFQAQVDTDTVKTLEENSILAEFPPGRHKQIMQKAMREARQIYGKTQKALELLANEERSFRDFAIEYHGKFSLPMACIIFLFIGAPLGSIIRKGGLGMPILFSVIFFLLFYVLMLQGKKMAREGVLDTWLGVWLPIIILVPIAAFLTYESTSDSKLLSKETWFQAWKRLLKLLGLLNPLSLLARIRVLRKPLRVAIGALLWLVSPEFRKERKAERRKARSGLPDIKDLPAEFFKPMPGEPNDGPNVSVPDSGKEMVNQGGTYVLQQDDENGKKKKKRKPKKKRKSGLPEVQDLPAEFFMPIEIAESEREALAASKANWDDGEKQAADEAEGAAAGELVASGEAASEPDTFEKIAGQDLTTVSGFSPVVKDEKENGHKADTISPETEPPVEIKAETSTPDISADDKDSTLPDAEDAATVTTAAPAEEKPKKQSLEGLSLDQLEKLLAERLEKESEQEKKPEKAEQNLSEAGIVSRGGTYRRVESDSTPSKGRKKKKEKKKKKKKKGGLPDLDDLPAEFFTPIDQSGESGKDS